MWKHCDSRYIINIRFIRLETAVSLKRACYILPSVPITEHAHSVTRSMERRENNGFYLKILSYFSSTFKNIIASREK